VRSRDGDDAITTPLLRKSQTAFLGFVGKRRDCSSVSVLTKKNACVNCFLKKRLFVSSKRSDISSKRQIFWIFLPLFCGEDSELVPTLSSRHNLYIYTHTRIKRAHRRSICTYETRATKRSENFFFSFACRAKRERAFYI